MRHDIRLAIRLLLKNPGFAVAAILTLALGIGANTAVFSVVNGVLLRPAPVAHLERLMMFWETDRNSSTTREPGSIPDYLDYKARARSFDTLAGVMASEVNFTASAVDPIQIASLRTSHEMFPMLGISPVQGRSFTAEEDVANGPAVALISESLWRRSLGGRPDVVGQTVRLDDRPYQIVGVMPDTTDFGVLQILAAAAYSRGFADRGERTRVDVWMPLQPDPQAFPRSTHPLFMLGRLAPGATRTAAQDEMAGIAADLERAYPENRARGAHVEALSDIVFGQVRPMLYVLLGAVGLVLLVACVNVASLLLARAAARAQEVALRRALGASHGQLLRQFLVESLLLTLVAATAGVGLAYLGVQALIGLAPADVPRLSYVSIDLPILGATLAISVMAGVAFGLIPTLHARRIDLHATLKDDGGARGTAGPGRVRLRGALVVAELAFAVMLLAGAGLLIRSFWNLQQVDPGFRAGGVLKAEYKLPGTRYPVDFRAWPNFKEQHAFTQAVLERAAALPGVVSVAVAGNHPLDPGFTNSFFVVGRRDEAQAWPEISVRRVTPGYFQTVDLALANGRLLLEQDATTAPAVSVINAAAAARFFPGRSPLGAQIQLFGAPRTIVGVVENERFEGLSADVPLAIYLPLAQAPSANGAGALLVRTSGDPSALAASVRAVVRERDPSLAVFGVEPLEATVSRSVSLRRFAMLLLGLFAGTALLLGAVGIHGVLSYDVARRRREIGIRMALGAQPTGILRLVVGQSAILTVVALAVGAAGAFALTRFLSALLFGVSAQDPATLVAVAALMAAVALAATAMPAWRAARTDPASALRAD
jgi:putative ABC transport system permease protein